jgi:hypothetical protein
MPRLPAPLLAALLLATPVEAGSLLGGHSVHSGGGPVVDGSGHVVTQARPLAGFEAVETGGPIEVDIRIGPQTAVAVEFDDNLQPQIHTELRGKTLVIDSTGSWSADDDPKVHITLPALGAVASSGSGNLKLEGLDGGDLALRLGGSGDMQASGRAASLALLLNGSGDMKLYDLKAANARVRLNGTGDMELSVSGTLDAAIYGTGDVRYRGEARVKSQVYGTGAVEKK